LTPPDHLHDKERLGYNPDVGTGDASLRRIDWIMGAFVGVGVVIAGWTYFRSSSVKKQRLEGAGGGGMKVNVSWFGKKARLGLKAGGRWLRTSGKGS